MWQTIPSRMHAGQGESGKVGGVGQHRLDFKASHGRAPRNLCSSPPAAQLLLLELRSYRTTSGHQPMEGPPRPLPWSKKKAYLPLRIPTRRLIFSLLVQFLSRCSLVDQFEQGTPCPRYTQRHCSDPPDPNDSATSYHHLVLLFS